MTPPGPQFISDFQLSAFFACLKDEGFSVFTVRGQKLGDPNPLAFAQSLRKNQLYVDATEIRLHFEQNKGRKLNFQGADEAELDKALKESMKTWEEESSRQGEGGGFAGQVLNAGKPKDDKPAFQTFTGAGVSLGGGAQ